MRDKEKESVEVKDGWAESIGHGGTFVPTFKEMRLSPLVLICVLIYVTMAIC